MYGSIQCSLYKHYFRLECRGELPFLSLWEKLNNLPSTPLFKNARERKKYSRYIYTRDLPGWSYPPYCRYGYYCKPCIYDLWNKKPKVVQLTLF